MIKGSLTITDKKKVANAVNQELLKAMFVRTSTILKETKPEISSIISKALFESTTVQDLLYGKLKDDFGLFGNVAAEAIGNIINYISDNVTIKIRRGSKNTAVSVTIDIPAGDLNKIISVPGGSFDSKGGPVNWLDWLLIRGTQVVVGDFWLYENAKGPTRSGGRSVMKQIGTMKRDPFRVDPGHAGTAEDNFITRALEPVLDSILDVIAAATVRSLK